MIGSAGAIPSGVVGGWLVARISVPRAADDGLAVAGATSLPAGVATRAEEDDVITGTKPMGSFAGLASPEDGGIALAEPALMPTDAVTAVLLAGPPATFASVVAAGK